MSRGHPTRKLCHAKLSDIDLNLMHDLFPTDKFPTSLSPSNKASVPHYIDV